MEWAISKNGVPIRLDDERWRHIVDNHDELAGHYDTVLGTVEDPQLVLRGYGGALIAVRGLGRRRHLLVVYRELNSEDGFVITAYTTSRLNRGLILWPESH